MEVLIALALFGAVAGTGVLLLNRTTQTSAQERRLAQAQERAYKAVTGLDQELAGKSVLAVLPGASATQAALVATGHQGYVVPDRFASDRFTVLADATPLSSGSQVFLLNGGGQGMLLTVLSVSQVSAGRWQVQVTGCQGGITLPWTPGTLVYPAEVYVLQVASGGLDLYRNGQALGRVATPQGFGVSFVYRDRFGNEQVSSQYSGMGTPDGFTLAALGLTATGGVQENRTLTGRIPVGSGWVRVREIRACGQASQNSGLATVTVVVDPNAPGGGDLTLSGNNYTVNFTATRTFQDVPAGNIRLEAREVVRNPEQGVTAIWAPSPALWTGRAITFAPISIQVGYSLVPGELVFSASGFPQDGQATVSAGPYSATLGGGSSQNVSALPGRYTTSASPEVSVSRSGNGVSWTEIYTLRSLSPSPTVAVSSRQTSRVSAAYSGPLPGTLCYDADCRQVAPGAYTAPADQLLNRYTTTRTESCPAGYTGSVTITETWERWRVWSPSVLGVSSRGTGSFFSSTEDRLVSETRSENCTPVTEQPTSNPPTTEQPTSNPPTSGNNGGGGGGSGGDPGGMPYPPVISPW
ncbi:hypothetical protein CSW23_00045 [Thermus scotoductus]|uniref:Uncharacterized protein n=1 Tax=Thermus scotoductus TaxID=37636 RepID=A0A430V754_THESC|nr:hypothetical protein [Thermus scotoductus]RTI21034.1 hypothetical protein CSW23_00045 [Thermus scotoductus]